MTSIKMEDIVRGLQCEDPACACRRNTTRKRTLHCPAHADKRPSLSLLESDGKILFHCFAGCTQDAVIRALKQKRLWWGDLSLKVKGVNVLKVDHSTAGLTLPALADAKKLPVEELRSYGLSDCRYSELSAVKIPYADAQGNIVAVRFRRSLTTEPRFAWRRGDKVTLYGQAMGEARRAGWIMIVRASRIAGPSGIMACPRPASRAKAPGALSGRASSTGWRSTCGVNRTRRSCRCASVRTSRT